MTNKYIFIISLGLFMVLNSIFLSCNTKEKSSNLEDKKDYIGYVEKLDDRLNTILDTEARIEVLSVGYEWTEGPLWISEGSFLLFSDIPPNRIYKWTEKDSISLYLEPSGYTGDLPRGGEPGSNGLLINKKGELVLCQHGDRRIAYMNAPIGDPQPNFITLVDSYKNLKLNSPNDAVFRSNGDLYFTDPPYGLEGNVNDPKKELPFQGVYLLKNTEVILLTDSLTRPNGIGLSPDESKLYVANSDPMHAIWLEYTLDGDGTIENGKVFFDATSLVGKEKGLPDGLKVSRKGHVFATGPGGVLVFSPEGVHLGTIHTTEATANCAFNEDESYLYITADMYLLRIPLNN